MHQCAASPLQPVRLATADRSSYPVNPSPDQPHRRLRHGHDGHHAGHLDVSGTRRRARGDGGSRRARIGAGRWFWRTRASRRGVCESRPVPRIAGALLFRPTPHVDERGFFSRTFDADIMRCGRDSTRPRSCRTVSPARCAAWSAACMCGRGAGEAKLVRCSYGAIFDVVVDLRPASPTYRNWEKLRAPRRRAGDALRARGLCSRLPGPHRSSGCFLPDRPAARPFRGRVDCCSMTLTWPFRGLSR